MSSLNWWKKACGVFVVCAATAIAADGQTFTSLLSFDGSDGNYPESALAQGTDGNLYGTTQAGGANKGNCVNGGCGTVFKITPAGALTTIYNFCAQTNCDDGAYPLPGLVLAADGNFYGTTYNGGGNRGGCDEGCGTVFRITSAGTLTTLYSFCAETNCADGAGPEASLLQAPDGNFYGTAAYGGGSNDGGIVFKISPQGALTVLYTFCAEANCSDGSTPLAALVQATDRNLYGTTFYGGANQSQCTEACGTIFKLTPSGALTTLYSFCAQTNCTDGSGPAGLVQASNGNFYGTTTYGGTSGNGTVFEITAEGKFTTLQNFHGARGTEPYASLKQATDGNLYGTTGHDGTSHMLNLGGTIFKISLKGELTTLYDFCAETNCEDGAVPDAGLIQSTNGNIYGTTFFGGDSSICSSCGTVFSLDMGLGSFVAFVQGSGRVGQSGGILGQGFTGTTGVSLNGIPASFSVVSDTFIRATVPAGATTGYVSVTTPSGTLTSNVPFHVIK
jgi:uncharacterized repeat protein (TIGR03803 family)